MAEGDAAPRARRGLALACAAILLTAADTYVVVLALPDIMAGVGLTSADLPRAAPIVSLFLLGYIAVLPLLGRLSDRYGRVPVLLACLVLFSVGSAVTAAASGLGVVVAGRFLQGLGGGGLVPVTLALVADAWPADRRGVPLGAVGAVQELGSVVGPLYGAALVAVDGWRLIFWANLAFGLVLAAGLATARGAGRTGVGRARSEGPLRRDLPGVLLASGALVAGVLALAPPSELATDVTWGLLVEPLDQDVPLAGLTTPLALLTLALVAAFVGRELTAARPALDLRVLPARVREVDALGALLLAAALGCVVLAFASPDPETQTLNEGGVPLLVAAAVLTVAFAVRERRAAEPLVPLPALRPRAAWGSLLVSLLVGAALIAALVDVPLFARSTRYPDSQLGAALVLLRFLVGLPLGALLGGALLRRVPARPIAVVGMLLATLGLALMARWDAGALDGTVRLADVELFVAGFGVGLAVAPVNDVALRAVRADLHGLISALVVVARSTGMLVGLSALTAYGLSRFRSVTAELPQPSQLCPANPLDCQAYADGLRAALLEQVSGVFAGAALCALLAAVAAAVLLRPPATPSPAHHL